ncbi:MAG: ethanolamine ammonia-lyase subunit EutC [Kiritimatiellae bacterium]|nr:ethanolamine ammonia-lyase subunit EutC [Kiritimatiellia bacterium]
MLLSATSANLAADPWAELRKLTPARLAMGRAGGSLRTVNLLDFRFAHALARDAVHSPFHPELVEGQLDAAGLGHVRVRSMVADKTDYLLHPERGRVLDEGSLELLRSCAAEWGRRDVAIVVSDGLSAVAAEAHAVEVARGLVDELGDSFSFYPVVVASFGRVKIADAVAEALGAGMAIVLLGERPGLGAKDSLSAYFTYAARNSSLESDRNCVSNIRPGGMPVPWAVRKLAVLMRESFRLKLSGTRLKDRLTLEDLARMIPLDGNGERRLR